MFNDYPPLMLNGSPDRFFNFIFLLESQFVPDINMKGMTRKIIIGRKRINGCLPEIDTLIFIGQFQAGEKTPDQS